MSKIIAAQRKINPLIKRECATGRDQMDLIFTEARLKIAQRGISQRINNVGSHDSTRWRVPARKRFTLREIMAKP